MDKLFIPSLLLLGGAGAYAAYVYWPRQLAEPAIGDSPDRSLPPGYDDWRNGERDIEPAPSLGNPKTGGGTTTNGWVTLETMR